MPSGAKKRKAAKRKKEEGMIGIHQYHPPPDSPTTPPQGNGSSECSTLTDEEAEGERKQMESSETDRGDEPAGREEERIQSKEVESSTRSDDGPAAPVVAKDVVVEEVVEAGETMVVASEASVAVEPPLYCEGEKREVPLEGPVGEQPRETEGSEVATTTEVAPTPLLERRASWLNCCGLLDVFRSSER